MICATVIGLATATVKHPSLEGRRMLVVQPFGPDGKTPDGDPMIAIDIECGAGAGQEVMITSDGKTARSMIGVENTPVRWAVIGIRDA